MAQINLELGENPVLFEGVVESQRTIPAVSIIMPVYNEGDAVVGAIRSAINRFESLLSSFELIVVDDGSTMMLRD